MLTRECPECGQQGEGDTCYHWDAAGRRKVPTRPIAAFVATFYRGVLGEAEDAGLTK